MKQKNSRYEIDMTQGPLPRKILIFAVPLMLSGMLQLLYNAADIVVVGQFAGSTALAAVSSTSSLINLIVTLFLGLSVGVSVTIANHYGAGHVKAVGEAVHTAIAVSLIGGIVTGVFGVIMARKFLEMMGSPYDVIDQATAYLTIIFAGLPASMLYNFGAAILRAIGDTRRPLYYLAIAGVINVALNLLTVIVFHMGAAGVALATIASQMISAALVIICLIRSHGAIHLNPRGIRLVKDRLLEIARVGIPAGLQGVIFSASNVMIQSSVNSFGSATVAGNGAASSLDSFLNVTINSISQTSMSFIGQNMGARQFRRIGKVVRVCMLFSCLLALVGGGLMVLFGPHLLSVYSADETVIAQGMVRLRVMCLTYVTAALTDLFAYTIRGTGHSLAPMLATALGVVGVRITWLLTVFPAHRTLEMLYFSYPVSWTATLVVHIFCFVAIYRKLIKGEAQSASPTSA